MLSELSTRELQKQMKEGIRRMAKELGRKFGCDNNPLLVSVRSGAR